jgi:hypothetical protein
MRDTCGKFIGPAVKRAAWDRNAANSRDATFTKGRIIVRRKLVSRGKARSSRQDPEEPVEYLEFGSGMFSFQCGELLPNTLGNELRV